MLMLVMTAAPVAFATGADATTGRTSPATGSARPAAAGDVVPGTVIVTLKPGVDAAAVAADYRRGGAGVAHVYRSSIRGFAGRMSDGLVRRARLDARVAAVEPDRVVRATDVQTPVTWGLDRVDQRLLPLSSSYTYSGTGSGITVYVLDSGVRRTHAEFGSRVAAGYDAFGGTGDDCHGHGTHVAGTIGGTSYGVAKEVTLVPVRVLDCAASGTLSGVIAGLDWVTSHHQAGVPAVANMSLGGGASSTLDSAVSASIADGITYTVSAGNANADACNYSPARLQGALTVGATTSSDARASFSNFGSCLDLFAPGASITSAGISSDTATATMSGTSMAAPHAAAAAALYLAGKPAASPADVAAAIIGAATADVVTGAGTGSPNRLLYTGYVGEAPAATAPSAPTGVTAKAAKRAATVSWTAGADGGSPITKFTVTAHTSRGAVSSTDVSASTRSMKFGGLKAGTSYTFTVTATNAIGTSPASAPSNAVTPTR